MCGRARCTMRPDDFPRACHLNARPLRHVDMNRFRPSYNVSPGYNVPVVRREDGHGGGDGAQQEGAVVHCMKWGLIPSFTKKTEKPDHFKMFNARSESLREKDSFRRLIPNNRCLVAVEGFYEWKKDGSKKQPYYIYFRDGRPLVFAALFDSWKDLEGEITYTFTIVTTSSSSTLEWLHDRMPVILSDKESTDTWLSGPPSSNFDSILKPYGESDLIQLKKDDTKTISQFFSKKGVNSKRDLNSESRTIKEEPNEDAVNYQLSTRSNEDDVKPDVSDLHGEAGMEVPAKRELEALSTDGKHSDDDDENLNGSPVKKKSRGIGDDATVVLKEHTMKTSPGKPQKAGKSAGNRKASAAGDKQPTLFSFFGKG